MPDFPEYNWEGYKLRLRPSDLFRKTSAKYGLPDFFYFNSSLIVLDLRIKTNKITQNTINYEWILCDKDDKQVTYVGDERFHPYNTQGNGVFNIANENITKIANSQVLFSKPKAVDIGRLAQSHFKIVMKFTDNIGITSDYKYMGQFTIFDKEKFRYGLFFSIGAIIIAAIIGAILHAFGLA